MTNREDVPKPTSDMFDEKGRTIGLTANGFIDIQDYNQDLTGTTGVEIYNQMRLGDATVRAALLLLTLPILSSKWWVEPGGSSRMAKKAAEFVQENIMESMTRSWRETLGEILLYLTFGRMPFEKVWEFRDDGLIYLRNLAMRWPGSVRRWQLDDGKPGVVQVTVNGKYQIPMSKLAVFVNQKEGDNWEGISVLRSAYKHWYTKDKYYTIDAIATERQGVGIPIAIAPQTGSTPADEAKVQTILRNIRANQYAHIVLPYGWSLGFMDMKGNQIKNPTQMVQHHDRQISKNILAQFIELGAGNVGSFALSRDQSTFFLMALESVANYVADTFTKYVINDLVKFNFLLDPKEYPKLAYEKIGKVDINTITTALQRAQQTGFITPQPEDEVYLREIMDLPEVSGKLADPEMVQPMLDELLAEADSLTLDESATPVADEMIEQVASDLSTMTASEFVDNYGANVHKIMTAGAKGVPLSDETKKKISEALKKNGGKGGSKAKGKKKSYTNDPEYKKKSKEAKNLQNEARKLSQDVQREMLEMKAKGTKLSPQDLAKKQLDILGKKSAISDKINNLKIEMQGIKDKYNAEKPAPAPKKAHEHDVTPTPEALLTMSEQVSEAINELKTAKS